jgi:hypothetical protein
MSNAVQALKDFLTVSPSVVFPDEVLELLGPVEDENAKLLNEVANMYREMQGVLDMSSDTVWVDKFGTLRDHMDAHMESMRELGIQPPDYDQRMRELGLAEEGE